MLLTPPHPSSTPPRCRRVPVASLPGPGGIRLRYPIESASWIWFPGWVPTQPGLARFKLKVETGPDPLRFQVSADQYFWLALDGHILTRGPDASPPWHYAFTELEATPAPGTHLLEAFVWWTGDHAPLARMTSGTPGFCLKGLKDWDETLTTGTAPWRVTALQGITPATDLPQAGAFGVGDPFRFDLQVLSDSGSNWAPPVVTGEPQADNRWGERSTYRVLAPTPLPELKLDSCTPGRIRAVVEKASSETPFPPESETHPLLAALQDLLGEKGGSVLLPAQGRFRILWDLETYHTGWPELVVSGGKGSSIRQMWVESLLEPDSPQGHPKGNRRQVAGKVLPEGVGDEWICNGETDQRLTPIWWRSGCYCLLEIETGDEPLELTRLRLLRSGHPFQWVDCFRMTPDCNLDPILDACRRTLEAGSWDTYEDSPFYEQLQYVSDTRLEILITYVCNGNADLPLRALELMDQSRQQWNGLCAARFPCRKAQLINTFSLLYVCCVQDLMMWRNEPERVRQLLPGVRHTLDIARTWENTDGLIEAPPGWSFVDWDPTEKQWRTGVPPGADTGISGPVNLIYLLSLQAAADLEDHLGEPEAAAGFRRRAERSAENIRRTFLSSEQTVLCDNPEHQHFSTQSQILGILTGIFQEAEAHQALDTAEKEGYLPPSFAFRFYLFEALRKLGRAGEIPSRLRAWQEMLDTGASTVFENQEPTRSDCHAWSSHPLFHLPCSVAGIRPASPGFRTVHIEPQPGSLESLEAVMAHPDGLIRLELHFSESGCEVEVELPEGIPGEFHYAGQTIPLSGGHQKLRIPQA